MDDAVVRIRRRDHEEVRVVLNEYHGQQWLDIRLYFQTEDGEWRPTRKGVSLRLDKLPELLSGLERLAEGAA